MKLLSGIFMFCVIFSIQAQQEEKNPASHEEVRETIETFFQGFHARDSVIMKSVTRPGLVMQSVSTDEKGKTVLEEENFSTFLQSIVRIPTNRPFREELHSFEIKVDGSLAHVWTPYSLYVDEVLSHCGTNSFQLLKENGRWRIISVIDTRRKEACETGYE